jgi:hypothetical protein
MAAYKVPQDVEADDKFFGPLSFKQFIFGGVSLALGYAMFYTISNSIWPVAIVLFPFFAGFTTLAFPWSKDQPTEIWLASRIRFFLVPHKRIWNQTGMKDLVAITVPKREVHVYTDGLSQDQVRSRFTALASVVDSRGWAVKTAFATAPAGANVVSPQQQIAPSDRLVEARADASSSERTKMVESTQDIMDDQKNPIAQQFNSLIEQSTEKHKQDTLAMIQQARHNTESSASSSSDPAGPMLPPIPQDIGGSSKSQGSSTPPVQDWLAKTQAPSDPQLTSFQDSAVVSPGADGSSIPSAGPAIATIGKADEEQLLQHVKQKKQRDKDIRSRSHVKVIKTPEEIEAEEREEAEREAAEKAEQARQEAEAVAQQQASTPPADPVILSLADNDDLNVETLSRQAKKDKDKLEDDTEVIISLR